MPQISDHLLVTHSKDNCRRWAKISAAVCYLIICIASLSIVCLILENANWILGDDCQFLTTTAVNNPSLVGWTGAGRFWPLGLFDYNMLTFIPYGCTSRGHYIYVAITFLITAVSFVLLLKLILSDSKSRPPHSSSLCSGLIIICYFFALIFTNGFLRMHMDVIFPERIILMLLLIFMLSYFHALKTQKNIYYAIALFSACYVTYCKEPLFGVFLVVSATNLIFRNTESNKQSKFVYFNYALIVNALVYLSLWYFFSFRNASNLYGFNHNRDIFYIIDLIFKSEKLLFAIFPLCFARAYFVFFQKDRKHLYLDGLLFSSAAYASAYAIIKLTEGYYFTPSVLLAMPSFVYWTNEGLKRRKTYLIAFSMAILVFLVASDFPKSLYFVEKIREKRIGDMKMVETLCRLKQSGTKIYFYKNTNVCYSDYMKNVWNTFMSYVSETLTSTASLSSKRYASAISGVDANSARENASPAQATLMHEISNVDSIPDHGIVLYPTSDIGDVGISKELSQKKFKLFNRRAVTNIYFDEALAKQNL